ncbi:hypothetical protein FQN50_001818 [Emmonsiellopsis sp. PD_5]|nr:hypothetical protein FQN50_001818 [Emmonsiellopsis sp. PD_5]
MGNTPSKAPESYPTAGNQPPASSAAANDRRVNRRTSIQALSSGKSTAADPSASRESATGHPISPRQHPPAQQYLQQSRNIPDTASSRTSDQHQQQQSYYQQQRDPRKSHTYASTYTYTSTPRDLPSRPNRDTDPATAAPSTSPEPSKAVRVPSAPDRPTDRSRGYHPQYPSIDPSGPTLSSYYGASSHLQRPPRLPLPIGDATTAPGSPIMAPSSGAAVVLDQTELGLSSSLSGEKGMGDGEEEVVDDLEPDADGLSGPGLAVPTKIEWRGPGEKVYVTGTFVNWERKFRLHKSETEQGVQTATLQLRQGTHHLKFIVDGIMSTSDQLPTAVDFTNHLVNYIEVSPEEVQRNRRESDRTTRFAIPPGLYPPQVLPESLEEVTTDEDEDDQREAPEEEIPLGDFRAIIPQFLTDIDVNEPETEEDTIDHTGSASYQRAADVIGDAPAPPMLPLLLGRSILNSATPMKDDSSVLNVPNHTVLNHLATSSIKNGVLATSVTTRYKMKCVTTIVYKPTGDITG